MTTTFPGDGHSNGWGLGSEMMLSIVDGFRDVIIPRGIVVCHENFDLGVILEELVPLNGYNLKSGPHLSCIAWLGSTCHQALISRATTENSSHAVLNAFLSPDR
jgi:hypothetical protein